MKRYYFFLFYVLLFAGSCGSSKNTEKITTGPNTRVYPLMSGYKVNSFSFPSNRSEAEKSKLKIEIVAGKSMEVDDCNDYVLTGNFEKKSMINGNNYYIFNTDGTVVSTTKDCLNKTTQTKFVIGNGLLLNYNNQIPAIVYTPNGIESRYRIWETSTSYPISHEIDTSSETEATKALEFFPDSIEGYERYVLALPPLQRSMNDVQFEIIPGITTQVDCNNYRLIGSFKEDTVEKMGYRYFIFESTGDYASIQMACPNNALKLEFVTGETLMLEYVSSYPIVIFAPKGKGFSVRYRVWESPKFAN